MPAVIPVKFAYASRDLWFDPADTGVVEGDHVICATERGTEIGLACSDPLEVSDAELNRRTDGSRLKPVVRIATDDDLDRASELADKGDEAFPTFRRLVAASGLDMKPVGVEYLFGGEKVVCYFAAEERVDFRQLVRDLSRELHERIDMRQIGVREEAALMGGFGHCGQELCCARFGSGFEPVSIRMAKEQDLPLNSNKISGACGRLMCCLRYEFEAYRDFKQRAPKKNAVIQTPLGTAKIMEYDTPKEQICLRLENGKQVRVPLAEMQPSEAARRKSEELGCPCRPDTVLRSTMDRLASPEVRAALEELDRKNGLIPEQTFDAGDIFVEERGGRRRRRNKGGNKGGGMPAQPADGSRQARGDAGDDAPRRRRRRKTVEISDEHAALLPGADGSVGTQSAPGEGKRSRRRHHNAGSVPGEGGPAQQGAHRQQPRQGKRRGEGDQGVEGSAPRRRRTRRPGDKGGVQQGDDKYGARQQAGEGRPPRPSRHMAPGRSEGPGEGGQQASGTPRRRRRHHHGGEGTQGGESRQQ